MHHMSLLRRVLLALGAIVLAIGASFLLDAGTRASRPRMQTVLNPTSDLSQEPPEITPDFLANPTPWPTILLPYMSPVPTFTETPLDFTPSPPPVPLTQVIKPEDGITRKIAGIRIPRTDVSANEATAIVLGRVKSIQAPRWSTVDGQRPTNPWDANNLHGIYRPVVIEVEQLFKGQLPAAEVLLYAFGGQIGQDSYEYLIDDMFTFIEGERVMVFVQDRGNLVGHGPFYCVVERYTITDDGQAINSLRTTSAQQLTSEIMTAVAPTPALTAEPVSTLVPLP